HALGAEQVFDRHRHAAQRPSGAGLRSPVGDPGERVQFIGTGSAAVGLEQLLAVELSGTDTLGCLSSRQLDELGHCAAPGVGTPKPCSTGSGAGASATSTGSDGTGSSSLSAFTTSIT